MKWIIPVPALTSLVIVQKYPLQPLNIGLPDPLCEFHMVFPGVHVELLRVVSKLVALSSQLHPINILLHHLIILEISHSFDILCHDKLNFLCLFSLWQFVQFPLEFFFGLFKQLLLVQLFFLFFLFRVCTR